MPNGSPLPSPPTSSQTPPQLQDYLAIVWRRRIIIVSVVLVAGFAALAISLLQTPRYRADAEVLISSPPSLSTLTGASVSRESLPNEEVLAESSEVTSVVSSQFESGVGLAVSSAGSSSVLTFSASSADPVIAASAADTYADAFIEARQQRRIDQYTRTSTILQQRITTISEELGLLRLAEPAAGSEEAARVEVLADQRESYVKLLDSLVVSSELADGAGAQVVQPATVPAEPFEPNTRRNVAVALLVGLVLGVGAAFTRENLDSTLRTDMDLAETTGLASLGVVPDLSTWKDAGNAYLVTRDQPRSASAEAYRGLRTDRSPVSRSRVHARSRGSPPAPQTWRSCAPEPGSG
jgi:uncharacterized protein involved in exopolysaccharide biosynthesis